MWRLGEGKDSLIFHKNNRLCPTCESLILIDAGMISPDAGRSGHSKWSAAIYPTVGNKK
jgi:hypothetical protein